MSLTLSRLFPAAGALTRETRALVQDSLLQSVQTAGDSAVTSVTGAVQEFTNMDPDTQIQLFRSLILIAVVILARGIAIRVMRARVDDIRIRYRWRKTITYVAVSIGVLLVGRVWFEGVRDLATFLGLLSAGLAVALRDPIVNMGGWLFIIWRRPFVVGDRVELGEHSGDVIDQRVFQFILLEIGNWVDADQSTGRLIHIPNGLVFREPLANYTRGMQYIWNEIPVLVTFESDWKKAKEILSEIVEAHARDVVEEAEQQMLKASRQYMIFYSTLTPTVYTHVKESGIMLTMRYLCHPRRRRGMDQSIWEDVLTRFAEADDIDFAYPTVRYYYNAAEGKPGTLPEPSQPDSGPPAPGV